MEGGAAKAKPGRKRPAKKQEAAAAGGSRAGAAALPTATQATATEQTGEEQPKPSLSQSLARSLRKLSQLAGTKAEVRGASKGPR